MRALRIRLAAIVAGVAAMLLVGASAWGIRQRSHEIERWELRLTARQFSGHLREFVATRVDAANLIRARMTFEGAVSRQTILREGASLQRTFPGYLAINWIDSAKRIAMVGPYEANVRALGRDLGAHPLVNPLLDRSRQTGETLMSDPLELYQTGSGFTTYTPVSLNGHFAGWLNTVYRLKDLKQKLPDSLSAQEIYIAVRDATTGAPVFTFGPPSPGASANTTVRGGIRMYGQSWVITTARARDGISGRWWHSLTATLGLMLLCGLSAGIVANKFIEKREQLRLSLERTNRDNLLLKTLVHDLSNHLQVIVASLELVQRLPETSAAEIKRLVEQAWVAAYHEQAILDQVRRMKAAEAGRLQFELEPVSLEKALQQATLAMAQRAQAKSIRIEPKTSLAPASVFAEPYSLQHNVLSNILSNAIKFSQPGGVVVYSVNQAGGEVCLSIEDRGEGIPAARVAAMFTEGTPATSPGTLGESGTGFGLLLVRAYMDLYGGRVVIESREALSHPTDHGTTVHLYFRPAVS